ncbi:MAG TPA: DinB family protein [Bryobacteraceae bacterium]|nr:DinB family protein [Bryobacteraceae bacterium]
MKLAKHQLNHVLKNLIQPLAAVAVGALPMMGADVSASARQIFDKQLSRTEREVLELVETMPANKFDFAPTEGAFKNVRTFGVQARHIAFCLNEVAIALLGETMLPHTDQEGPANLTSKDDIVKYLKAAFAHAHRAIGTLTNENLLEQISDPYNDKLRTTRVDAAGTFFWHTYDHYGQMVEYLRMNNLVPPGHQ